MTGPALISLAIKAATVADQDRLGIGLRTLQAEDGTISVTPEPADGGVVIACISELQLEIIVDRLKREFGVVASVGRPQIAYEETVTRPGSGEMKYYERTDAGPRYAHVRVRVYPGSGYVFDKEAALGVLPDKFIEAVDEGIQEALTRGVFTGYRVDDVRVVFDDGSYSDVESSELAFRIAGAMAFRDAARRAGPAILEPIMQVDVDAPEEHMQAVLRDLLRRRGAVRTHEAREGRGIITACVPLSQMFGYASGLQSQTGGRGTFRMEFDRYRVLDMPDGDEGSCDSLVRAPRNPVPYPRLTGVALPEPHWNDPDD